MTDSSDITVVVFNNGESTRDSAVLYNVTPPPTTIVKILFVVFITFVCLQLLKNNRRDTRVHL